MSMAGDTTIISIEQFREDWVSHVPISELCERYGVTKDQVIRLKSLWKLPPRHNRALRIKPKWTPPPAADEIAASEASCDLAPEVARRVAELRRGVNGVQIHGTYVRREEEAVPFSVPVFSDWRSHFSAGKNKPEFD